MQTIWNSIKRNPIILAAIAIVALQMIEDWGNITQQDWFQNLFTMAIAFMAREFTVPLKEAREGYAREFRRGEATEKYNRGDFSE